MKRWVSVTGAVAALAMASSGGALAQSGAQAPVDPARMALARQMVEQNGGEQAVKTQMNLMFELMKKNMEKEIPSTGGAVADQLYDDLEQELDGLVPQLIDVNAKIYAENYTDKEMRDMLAFQMSDSGRSIMKKMPAVRAQAINETLPLVMTLMPNIMQKTADRVCEAQHCNAKERKFIEAALTKALQR